MKYLKYIFYVLSIGTLSCFPVYGTPTPIVGETMLNPDFNQNDYYGWVFSGSWRNDGIASRIVYDLLSEGKNKIAFSLATGSGKNGMQIAKENNLDPDSSYFRGFEFAHSRPYFAKFGDGTINGEYELYFEATIQCTDNMKYRVQSSWLKVVPHKAEGPLLNLTWEWVVDSAFSGDPARQNNGLGIKLNSIENITYTAVIWAKTPNTTLNTHYVTIDNMNLSYKIENNAAPVTSVRSKKP